MARTRDAAARLERLSPLLVVGLVAVSSAVAFGRVFEGAGTTWALMAVAGSSATLAWALERRGLILATFVSAAGLVVALGLVVFRATTWYGLPTLETLRRIADAAGAVGEQARVQTSPAPAIDPLLTAAVVAVWAATFSCHALAIRSSSPLLSLVPPVALLAFADTVLEKEVVPAFGLLFLPGAIAVVLADGMRRTRSWGPVWGRRGREDRVGGIALRGARGLSIAALALATFAPAVLPGFGSAGLIDVSQIGAPDRLDVDPLVSVAAELNRDESIEVFRVTTETPSYWRMITLDTFDGITWRSSREDAPGTPVFPSAPLVAIQGAPTFEQRFEVSSDLGYPWLAVAPEPLYVQIDGAMWDPLTATVSLETPLDEGTTYAVTSSGLAPERDALAQAPVGADPRYLELPPELPSTIGALTRQWVDEAEATSPYEATMAIQQRLRSFTYDTDVEWRDDSASLVRFLTETRTGFCQQFASAMAVMLRSIGLPTRVAVGFTTGSPAADREDTYVVSTDDLHSWVEVHFPAHGWLAFEPTPGRSNPAAPWQDPEVVRSCGPRSICPDGEDPFGAGAIGGPRTGSRRVEVTERDTGVGAVTPIDRAPGGAVGAVALVVLGLVALLGLVPLIRAIARRRRFRRVHQDPRRTVLVAYDVLLQRAAELGVGRSGGETPIEYHRRIEGTVPLVDGNLTRLTALTVRAAYAADGTTADDAADARADADATLDALQRSVTWRRRLTAPYRRG